MISDFLTHDHHHCDELFAQAEEQAANGAPDDAAATFERFHQEMERHFSREELILFPRLESVAGEARGPTAVMRAEHNQLRALMVEMNMLLEAQEADAFLDGCETLLILMQQHNLKEESMLYPMADQLLSQQSEALLEKLRDVALP
jgi:hemerythrin-like domain-containing protein